MRSHFSCRRSRSTSSPKSLFTPAKSPAPSPKPLCDSPEATRNRSEVIRDDCRLGRDDCEVGQRRLTSRSNKPAESLESPPDSREPTHDLVSDDSRPTPDKSQVARDSSRLGPDKQRPARDPCRLGGQSFRSAVTCRQEERRQRPTGTDFFSLLSRFPPKSLQKRPSGADPLKNS
jgi:hypothetical protein